MMKRPQHFLAATAAVALVALTPLHAAAQDDGTEESALTISGFIDTSASAPIVGDDFDVVYGLDEAEVDFDYDAGTGLGLRLDLNVFPAAGVLTHDGLIEQGYAKYYFGGGSSGTYLLVGKQNAPIGIEALDPTDMYQFSKGQLFTFATPSNLTGGFLGYDADSFSAMLWFTNDWDQPSTVNDGSVGGRLEYALSSGHIGLSSTYGPIEHDEPLLMLDVDAAFGFGAATLFLEGNYGTMDEATTMGALIKLNYALNDSTSVTVRGDYLDSEVFGVENSMSATAALLFPVTDGFGGVFEVRADIPDEGDTMITPALELTASF